MWFSSIFFLHPSSRADLFLALIFVSLQSSSWNTWLERRTAKTTPDFFIRKSLGSFQLNHLWLSLSLSALFQVKQVIFLPFIVFENEDGTTHLYIPHFWFWEKIWGRKNGLERFLNHELDLFFLFLTSFHSVRSVRFYVSLSLVA